MAHKLPGADSCHPGLTPSRPGDMNRLLPFQHWVIVHLKSDSFDPSDRMIRIGLKSPQCDMNRLIVTPGDFNPFQKPILVTQGRLQADPSDRVTRIGLKSPQGVMNRLLVTPG
ncbi:hypothetical protein DPMN_169571 [Dreissena polymorpha]|uniref:Uncharacterized protein n=1 Tax=Dreissena polymorpha TaxID=45954 RepID=A0A9D4DY03_DREPO|nr:hypothetical protein DPMN_169571 [Dreissena polymorpha]